VNTRPSARLSLVRRCITGAAAVALIGGLATYSVSVSASPKPTIAQVTAQVKTLSGQADKAIQQYDQVKQQLAGASQRLKLIDNEVARDQAQFKIARRGVAAAAATAYEDGNLTSMAALITSASPQTVLSRASMLVQLSTTRSAQMHQFVAAARQLSGAQQAAKRTKGAITTLRNQAHGRVVSMNKALSQKKSLLATLTAQQQRTVAAAAGPAGGHAPGPGTRKAPRPAPASGNAGQAVSFAYAQLGCPYVFGGTGPCSSGYDCSGLAQAAWAYAGVSIPRDTYEQWAALPHIPMSQLQPGDLIYFNGESHVAIYVGGNMIIDAPTPGQNVEKVALSGWYASTEDGAVRP
jgi:cell wall-associated NlpC family hydrolase